SRTASPTRNITNGPGLEFIHERFQKEKQIEHGPFNRPFVAPELLVAYLCRYTHRVDIGNERLVRLEQGTVHFRWRDYNTCVV
ncbi:MAG: transposase, partial [Gammaproteobacteria bacterium]